MDEIIKSKLAIDIAQLSLDKATLAAQCEELQRQLNLVTEERDRLLKELDKMTDPTNGGENL